MPAHWVEGSLRCRNFEPRYAFYAKQASGYCLTDAAPESLWAEICRIGDRGDFFSLNLLWWIRRLGDWLIGGPSLRRHRRHPAQLRYGDVIDRLSFYAPYESDPERWTPVIEALKAI